MPYSFLGVELPSAPAGQFVHGHRWGQESSLLSPLSTCPAARGVGGAVAGDHRGALQPCGQQDGGVACGGRTRWA